MDRLNKRVVLSGAVLIIIFCTVVAVLFLPKGDDIFRQQNCLSCHRFKSQGGMAGPDLSEIRKRRGTFWIITQINNPKSHNPESRMPSYRHLSYLEIYAISYYLKSE